MLFVLKNIVNIGELTIDVWMKYLTTLSFQVLKEYSRQSSILFFVKVFSLVFFALIPFLKDPSAGKLFTYIFEKLEGDDTKYSII